MKIETTETQEIKKTTPGKSNTLGLMTLGLFLGIIFIGVVALMNRPKTGDEDHLRAAVTEEFLDPSSAEFRNIRWLTEYSACGEVNGSNSFGGKTGFQPFYAWRSINTGKFEVFLSGRTETDSSFVSGNCKQK